MQVLGADCLPESPLPSARYPVQGASLVARVPVLESPPPGSRRGGGSRLRGPCSVFGIGWQVAEKSLDGFAERAHVVVDRCLDDGMGSVEVAVRQVIAHRGDLAPRDGRFGVEERKWKRLDGFSDLQQPDPDRVEDQPVGQISMRGVGADGGDCGQYVLQTLGLAVRRSGTTSAAMRRPTSGLSPSAGTRSMVEPSTDSSASRARPRRIRLVPGGSPRAGRGHFPVGPRRARRCQTRVVR